MDCELNMQKRSHEKSFSPSKKQRLEVTCLNENTNIYVNEVNMQSLGFSDVLDANGDFTCPATPKSSDMSSTNNLQVTDVSQPTITNNHSTNLQPTYDDAACFPNSSCDFLSAKDYLNNFFKELEFSNIPTLTGNLDESLQKPPSSISHAKDELQCITPPTLIQSVNTIHRTKGRSSKSIVFQKELSDFIFLTLRLHNRQYHVHIREFNRNVFTKEEIPTKNGIIMDINSWYEFQYKIFAFNLRYKSSSFIANNTILVLNYDNSVMRIKNLRNYSSIDLSDFQLEKLKEVAYDLNKNLIHHMYTKQLPYLIKNQCTVAKTPPELELVLTSKLFFAIEKNVLTILNRIYECHACIFNQHSKTLHSCFLFNNREKFQQLGDMVLMLVNLDFVVSMFSNEVDYISEHFLCNINVETIKNVLFKTEK